MVIGVVVDAEPICATLLEIVERRMVALRMLLEEHPLSKKVPRALLHMLCIGVLRNYRLLEAALRYCGYSGPVRGSRRGWLPLIIAYEAVFRRKFVGLDKLSRYENIVGFDTLKCLSKLELEDVLKQYGGDERLSIEYSVPLWLIRKLKELQPPHGVESLLRAFNERMPQWIRFNRSIIDSQEAVKLLARIGVEVEPDPVLDDLLMIKSVASGSLAKLDPRMFYVQDRSAALVAHVLGCQAQPLGDFFSAPGGKVSHVVWRCLTPAVSIEISRRRLAFEQKLLKQQQVWCSVLVEADARKPPIRREGLGAAIVDPDCSSIGRIGHSPETRLFLEMVGPSIVNRLSRLQRRALATIVELVKRGGVIVYSTCTLTFEENEYVVKWVADNYGVEIVEAKPWIGVPSPLDGRMQRIYPHTSKCSGGFVAKLLKV